MSINDGITTASKRYETWLLDQITFHEVSSIDEAKACAVACYMAKFGVSINPYMVSVFQDGIKIA
jgi:hypothetical protein